jgi:integrase
MPRRAKGIRLWLQPARFTASGKLVERAVWCIRDGSRKRSTGCPESEIAAAEEALGAYIVSKHSAPRAGSRHPTEIEVADVLNIYLSDRVPDHADQIESVRRIAALEKFFGADTLADINGPRCRKYLEYRQSSSAARRELEDLRAAINYHRREGLCSEIVSVWLPERPEARVRWMTRSEAARLIWAAWRYKEKQNLRAKARYTRRHVARFILVGLYTGTRSAAICGAALQPTVGTGWVDVESGVFYRKAVGERATKKRKPTVRLHPRLLAHMRRWKKNGQRYVVEWNDARIISCKKAFGSAVRDADLLDVTAHVLRHTAATWMMQSGKCTIYEAAGYLGMTVETLEQVYGHHHPDFQKQAIAAFDRPRQFPDRNTRTDDDSSVSVGADIVRIAS